MKYCFSIIIPHRNIPGLLQRCLDSIPKRDDIQVIIVDDNSDPSIVDFDHFPGLNQTNIEIYFDKSGKGAGRARNIGLEHVRGLWTLFADADDFYCEEVLRILDKYKVSNADIIYFKHKNVYSDDISKEGNRCYFFNEILDGDLLKEEKKTIMRCRHNTPWSKMFSSAFIKRNGLRFEEIPFSNDIFFSITAGCIASKVELSSEVLYVLTERSGSLTNGNSHNIEELCCRAMAHVRMQAIAEKNGYKSDYNLSGAYLDVLYDRDIKLFRYILRYCRDNKLSSYRILRRLLLFRNFYSRLRIIYHFCLSFLK